uniref:SVWC domain-containing protein n=1 Tax=Steinernema glaseri TaxID=37863 RepID=A0A1I7ZJ23_9BILA
MKTKVLVLFCLVLLLAVVNGEYCFETSDDDCGEEYWETDVDDDGDERMCCDEPTRWPKRKGCYQRPSFLVSCPSDYARTFKFFSSFWLMWCCPVNP